jgi:hypothetical protein
MAPDDDDIDDVLDDRKADLEARFRELEREAEIERMRGGAPRAEPGSPPPAEPKPSAASGPKAGGADRDPLADLKAAVEGGAALERYLLVLCPHCDAKNRMSLAKVRTASPICGRCKRELSFAKY